MGGATFFRLKAGVAVLDFDVGPVPWQRSQARRNLLRRRHFLLAQEVMTAPMAATRSTRKIWVAFGTWSYGASLATEVKLRHCIGAWSDLPLN